MTLRTGLLWVLAALAAGALAHWDYVHSSADAPDTPGAAAEHGAADVEVEVIYEDVQ
jgi:hypothetical protein